MPRTRPIAWAELRLGVVGLVAAVLAAVLISAVGGQGGFFWQRYTLKTRFDNVNSLKTGSLVRVSGMDIGKVTHLAFAGPQVEVTMELSKDVKPIVTNASVARLGSLTVLGEPVVDVTASSQGTPLENGSYIQTGGPAGVEGMMESLIADIRAGKGTLGRLIMDRRLYENLNNAAVEMRGLIDDARRDPKKFFRVSASIFGGKG